MRGAQVAAVVSLLTVITVAWVLGDEPAYGTAFYALIPIVLSAFWFGRRGAVLISGMAAVVYLVAELIWRSPTLQGPGLWVAAANRSVIYLGVALTVTSLLNHERRLRTRVGEQQEQLAELEPLRAALTPPEIPSRPGLELATAFHPAEGSVAGDFFLVVAGPARSTTLVIGDVVGHGLAAARLGVLCARDAGHLRALHQRPGPAAATGQHRTGRTDQ